MIDRDASHKRLPSLSSSIHDLAGAPQIEVLNDLEWWFTKFTRLRNSIAHGDEVRPTNHRWGRSRHLWVAESRLRAAIKETVASAGHPDVRLTPFERATRLAADELFGVELANAQ